MRTIDPAGAGPAPGPTPIVDTTLGISGLTETVQSGWAAMKLNNQGLRLPRRHRESATSGISTHSRSGRSLWRPPPVDSRTSRSPQDTVQEQKAQRQQARTTSTSSTASTSRCRCSGLSPGTRFARHRAVTAVAVAAPARYRLRPFSRLHGRIRSADQKRDRFHGVPVPREFQTPVIFGQDLSRPTVSRFQAGPVIRSWPNVSRPVLFEQLFFFGFHFQSRPSRRLVR